MLLDRGGGVRQLVELPEIVQVLPHGLLRRGLQRRVVEQRAGLPGDLFQVADHGVVLLDLLQQQLIGVVRDRVELAEPGLYRRRRRLHIGIDSLEGVINRLNALVYLAEFAIRRYELVIAIVD
jgi:hypothetical protein